MPEKSGAAIAGRAGRFSAPNKIRGWVLVHENEQPARILVKYRGETVGTGLAELPQNIVEPETGRKRFGFIVKLTRAFSDSQAQADDFRIYAETGAGTHELRKSAQFTGDSGKPAALELSEISVEVGTKSEDGSAVIGREGFFFLIGGSNKVEQLYQTPDSGVSDKWSSLVASRAAFCDGQGIAFLQVFLPEKLTVLSDYYRGALGVPTPTYAKLKENLSQNVKLAQRAVFFEELLGAGVSPEQAFKKTDSHFTGRGARLLFDRQLDLLTGKSEWYEITGAHELAKVGDLGEKFTSLKIYEKVEVLDGLSVNALKMDPTLVSEELPPKGHMGTKRIYVNEQAPIRKKVVAFANSFFWRSGSSLGQCWWYSRLFSEFHFVWSPDMLPDYIRANKPDIVVCQTIERYLRRVPSY